ncbi:MAG: hypothetical protein ACTSUE_20845 [Promethearchaeota archaeon]
MKGKKGYIFLEIVPTSTLVDVKGLISKYLTRGDYCCSVQGKYQIVIEKVAMKLQEIDTFITTLRKDDSIRKHLARTITFLGIQA